MHTCMTKSMRSTDILRCSTDACAFPSGERQPSRTYMPMYLRLLSLAGLSSTVTCPSRAVHRQHRPRLSPQWPGSSSKPALARPYPAQARGRV
jgi:hypothetical protein